MLIIAGHTELDPDDGDGAVAVIRDLVTRTCDAPGCLDVAITVDSADPTGTVLTGRRTAEQVDHWNGDYHGVLDELLISHVPVLFGAGRRLFGVLTSRIGLEIVRVIDAPEATHLRYCIHR